MCRRHPRHRADALRTHGYRLGRCGWWQSHPADFTCDGAWHTGTYTIGTFEYGISELQRGKGWLQFCLSYGDEQIEAIETRWVEVID